MILLTGASGFIGSSIWDKLLASNCELFTLGRQEICDLNHDISKVLPKLPAFTRVIHCAGKAHMIPKRKHEIDAFYEVNYQGTVNLCEALELSGSLPSQFVFISTVAVYGLESGSLINESSPLNGTTPYAKSKIKAEEYLQKFCTKHSIKLLILRLPLVVGKNPPGNLGKMIYAIKRGRYVSIGSGSARKSMVLAKDIAKVILDNPTSQGIFNLTDGKHPMFFEIENAYSIILKKKKPLKIPLSIAKIIGKLGDWVSLVPINSDVIKKMTTDLTFDDSKAQIELNWKPNYVIDWLKGS